MNRRICGIAMWLVGWALASPVGAQTSVSVRAAALFESYSFDPGLGFEGVREFTLPVVVGLPLGSRADLTLATGYARVEMDLVGESALTRTVSGALDTEARLAVTVLRDRLRLLVTGSVPTGTSTFTEDEAVLVGPLANDLFGFAAPTLGSGGSVGVGVVGAAPAGRASVGYGLTFRVPLSFEPILGSGDEVRAGNELRARIGLETPVGRRSFFRLAGILSTRSRDELNGVGVNGVGNRVAGYAALDAPLGPALATLWASGLYRSDPSLEPTAVGAAFVPRGSLLAAGLRLGFALGAATRFEPSVEYRSTSAAADEAGLDLEKQGDLLRAGARLRHRLVEGASLVIDGALATGMVWSGVESVGTRGFRLSAQLEWTR